MREGRLAPLFHVEVQLNQGTIEGQCNAGCLLFISAACSDRQKTDASDITLYTQLAASKKHSRMDTPDSWKQTWLAALNRFGWVLKAHETLSLPAAELDSGTLWEWTHRHVPVFFPRQLVREGGILMKRSVAAHPEQPALELLIPHIIEPVPTSLAWDQMASVPEHRIGLQFAYCGPTSGLNLVVLSLKTRQSLKSGFLIEVLDPKAVVGNVEVTYYSVEMLERIYGPLRASIGRALEERRVIMISPLQEVADDHTE
jgi:hypothetical protein